MSSSGYYGGADRYRRTGCSWQNVFPVVPIFHWLQNGASILPGFWPGCASTGGTDVVVRSVWIPYCMANLIASPTERFPLTREIPSRSACERVLASQQLTRGSARMTRFGVSVLT